MRQPKTNNERICDAMDYVEGIAYDDCRSSTYLFNCDLDIRYLLTDAEMWPDEVDEIDEMKSAI